MWSSHTTHLAFSKHVIEVTCFMLIISFPKINQTKLQLWISPPFFQSKLFSLCSYRTLFYNTITAFALYFFMSWYLWLFLWPNRKLYKAGFSLILWQCNIHSINIWMNISILPTWFFLFKIKNLLNRMGPWYLRMFITERDLYIIIETFHVSSGQYLFTMPSMNCFFCGRLSPLQNIFCFLSYIIKKEVSPNVAIEYISFDILFYSVTLPLPYQEVKFISLPFLMWQVMWML